MTRRLLFSLAAGLALAACSEAPTSNTETPPRPEFILDGAPDNGEHPYVAFVLFYDAPVGGWFRCSGSLLDAKTVLTAGHCTLDVGTNGGLSPNGRGGNDVWVTFTEQVNLAGFPPSASGYAARAEWLNTVGLTRGFIRGTAHAHPDFDGFPGTNFPNTTDVGVVDLDAASPVTSFARIPGQVDALFDLDPKVIFDIVGYGLQDAKPVVGALIRTKGQAKLGKLDKPLAGGVNLPLSNNNGTPHRGGICSGDSGGPVLFNGVVYGVHSFGRIGCKGPGYSYRTDLQPVLQFVRSFLD